MFRQLYIIVFLIMASFSAFAQNVGKAKFEKTVDYINCQITKVSLTDQVGQAHLKAFNDNVGNHNCDFESLVVFLKTRETGVMTKNLELSYFINSYKDKYEESLTNAELFAMLRADLLNEAPLQNFKIRHEKSFPKFETTINDYMVRMYELKETATEVIDDGNMGEIVMVDDGEKDGEIAEPEPVEPEKPSIIIEEEEAEPTVITPYVEKYSPFEFEEGNEVFAWSSWLFRFSLLFFSLAVLLFVLLPYYEKREKAKVKQPGGEVHPEALSLQVEIAIMENNNRLLKEKIREMHLDLNDYEDTFRSF